MEKSEAFQIWSGKRQECLLSHFLYYIVLEDKGMKLMQIGKE